ncbi:MAG: hypothetical protein IPM11_01425 [Micropruina sp.]|nr:hypothetical protein [Micropruina sp.]
MEADFQQIYGFDCDHLHRRSWFWVLTRLEGLFAMPPLVSSGMGGVLIIQQSRIAHALHPPEAPTGSE